jgi:ribose 5-phosphate isomerase B
LNSTVAIANDHAGVALKSALLPEVEACGFSVIDLGTATTDSVDYPDYGYLVADAVTSGRAQFGIAICGTGIGISIAANRKAGARAALCHNAHTARLARQHNDANIIALGARILSEAEAKECVRQFLTTDYEGGRHDIRVKKLG